MRTTQRNLTCGRCSTKGHQSNNKGCPQFETASRFNVDDYFTVEVTEFERKLMISLQISDFYVYNDDVDDQIEDEEVDDAV